MLKDVAIIFISIFFESLPFILLGSIISGLIETYISNDALAKLIPKNKFLGSIVGILLGFFLPACDCAVIPVSKRLIKKNVPINVAISFMLASPIINPVVLLSTYYAFYNSNPSIFWMRISLGIVVSLIIGTMMGILFGSKSIILNDSDKSCCDCENECNHHEHNKIVEVIKHTLYDMFDVLKFLIVGALIASMVQVFVPKNLLLMFNNNSIVSILTLMLFAYLISLCSTSDSFVGRSLLSSFGAPAILAYLLLGPMIDIKNTIVLIGNYNKKFVATLISLIFIIIFLVSMMVVNIV